MSIPIEPSPVFLGELAPARTDLAAQVERVAAPLREQVSSCFGARSSRCACSRASVLSSAS